MNKLSRTSTASGGGSQTATPAPLLSCGGTYANGATQIVISWQTAAKSILSIAVLNQSSQRRLDARKGSPGRNRRNNVGDN